MLRFRRIVCRSSSESNWFVLCHWAKVIFNWAWNRTVYFRWYRPNNNSGNSSNRDEWMIFSTCVVQGSRTAWQCTRRKCVVRSQLIERINSADFGYISTSAIDTASRLQTEWPCLWFSLCGGFNHVLLVYGSCFLVFSGESILVKPSLASQLVLGRPWNFSL